MTPTIIRVSDSSFAVHTKKISSNPLAFAVRTVHPKSGELHEHTITIGASDSVDVPDLAFVQHHLDAAREHVAKKCYQNYKLNEISEQLV